MKKGNIYKVYTADSIFTGMYLGDSEGFLEDKIVKHFIDIFADEIKVNEKDIIKTTSTRLNPEARKIFEKIFTSTNKLKKLQAEIEKSTFERWKESELIREYEEQLRNSLNIIKVEDVIKDTSNVIGWTENKTQTENITFSLMVYKEKYARYYDFLTTEYDGSLHIGDMESCTKQLSKELPDAVITLLTNKLKHFKLQKIYDSADIGDKNTLNVYKSLVFSIDHKSDIEDLKREAKIIDDWITEKSNKLRNL